jgi:DNA-binding response OmpR family regulator
MSNDISPKSTIPTIFPASRFANARILIIDDAPYNVKLIASRLEAAGYKNIETAQDGLDGLEKTAIFRPELVLLDIMMPNLDGFGYCERIRADKTADPIPIIVQTALGDRESMLRALTCGADDFLKKPLDMEEINLRVYVHLKRYFMLQDLEKLHTHGHPDTKSMEAGNDSLTLLKSPAENTTNRAAF